MASKPRKSKVPRPPEDFGETCLQKHTNQWLRKQFPRLLAFHVPNERQGGIGAVMHFRAMGVLAGVADWLIFPRNGRKIAIELKDATGPQREAQERFENEWKATGGEYYLVRTLEDFQRTVTAVVLF